MDDCIFCKIAKGEIPSKKIHETQTTLTFLDIQPATKGHMLTIPKKHYKNIHDAPQDLLCEIITITKKLSKLAKEKLGADGINIMNSNEKAAQQDVEHIHFHTVPRYDEDELNIWHGKQKQELNLEEIQKQLI